MWVITERSNENPQNCWISAIFKNQSDVEDYSHNLQSVVSQEIREIPAKDYPIIIVEDLINSDYFYITPGELAEKIFSFERKDDDHQYCIYFIFREDYRNTDELGLIQHKHVDNDHIKGLIWRALEDEVRGQLNGIFQCDNCRECAPGILTERGYEPPPGWRIIPSSTWDSYFSEAQMPEKFIGAYLTVCSEACITP